ncbi:hypothetical protein F5Y04DRAFT_285682 [Hypomontagnella monticulosa]|nr:hypothetical protein F5Y04DRAFT_285682 [Hypomontagnella monticulosa]
MTQPALSKVASHPSEVTRKPADEMTEGDTAQVRKQSQRPGKGSTSADVQALADRIEKVKGA